MRDVQWEEILLASSVRTRHRLPPLIPPPAEGEKKRHQTSPTSAAGDATPHRTRNGCRPERRGPGGTRGPERIRSELFPGSRPSHPEETRPRHGEVQQEGAPEAPGRGEVDRREPGPALLGSGGSPSPQRTLLNIRPNPKKIFCFY